MKRLGGLIVDGVTVLSGLAAVAIVGKAFLTPAAPSPFDEREDRTVPHWRQYAEDGRIRGSDEPILTLVVFGDYQCPACASFEEMLRSFVQENADQVRVIFRHWPLSIHPRAYQAARATECAGDQGKFWHYHDALFVRREWSDDALGALAVEVGIPDLRTFDGCLASDAPHPRIESGIRHATELDAFGTPAVIANGVLLGKIPTRQDLLGLLESPEPENGG